mgnify:FL=1
MWINSANQLYIGDCAPGDRAATDQEVADWNAARERARIDALSVTPWQFRKALNATGLRAAADAAVAASSQDVKDGDAVATEVRRSDPMIISMGGGLGKTSDEIDALFLLAETL